MLDPAEVTQTGFKWGPAEVVRVGQDAKGRIVIAVRTEKKEVLLGVSPKGRSISVTQFSK